jgi:hypothetical protein
MTFARLVCLGVHRESTARPASIARPARPSHEAALATPRAFAKPVKGTTKEPMVRVTRSVGAGVILALEAGELRPGLVGSG